MASDVIKGQNTKTSFKKNTSNASSDAIEAVTSIGAAAIKRKLSEKTSKKNKTKNSKRSKQKGSGYGSLFD